MELDMKQRNSVVQAYVTPEMADAISQFRARSGLSLSAASRELLKRALRLAGDHFSPTASATPKRPADTLGMSRDRKVSKLCKDNNGG